MMVDLVALFGKPLDRPEELGNRENPNDFEELEYEEMEQETFRCEGCHGRFSDMDLFAGKDGYCYCEGCVRDHNIKLA